MDVMSGLLASEALPLLHAFGFLHVRDVIYDHCIGIMIRYVTRVPIVLLLLLRSMTCSYRLKTMVGVVNANTLQYNFVEYF
jgi:hypothetical protein